MADNREAIMFKAVQDGYVFRALNPFVFGRARYYLVNEAQKAQLLAIVTARSPAVSFWLVLLVLIAVGTGAVAYATGHDDPTVSDVVILLALIPLWLYAAVLVSQYPTARKLQPLLAGLQPTDQSITSTDLRKAVRKTVSFRQHLALGISQAALSAACIVMIVQKTNGGHVAVLDDSGTLLFAFNAVAFGFSSICFLIKALDKVWHKKDEPDFSDRSIKSFLLTIFCLVISLGLLGFVVTSAWRTNQRNHEMALIQQRIDGLSARIDAWQIRSRAASAKARIATNNAHMSELITKLKNPAVKCETPAPTDDPARVERIGACRELARKEQDVVQREIAATNEEMAIIQQDNAALQKENDAIQTEFKALQTEIKAKRRSGNS
ncbi:MAG: hypothetical protein H0V72_14095 [Bradyrhizobium sp.]|nr:hypothetical protein [Bradyrhizobium sp.]